MQILLPELCNPKVNIVEMENNDSWTRDTAPTFVINKNGNIFGVDWTFNGWGNMEFANYDKDKFVAKNICSYLNIPTLSTSLVNEGGAIHVDGNGTLICTKTTLLNANRNPDLTAEEVEVIFKELLGITQIIWLEDGYEDDETDGHIDVIASFVEPGKIMHLYTDDSFDNNFNVFNKNINILENSLDAKGNKLKVIKIPQPSKKYVNGRRLAYSYMNFYIANGAVIVPTFNDKLDNVVLEIFREQFKNRKIIGFDASLIFHGGGGIHCITQQEPKVQSGEGNECK